MGREPIHLKRICSPNGTGGYPKRAISFQMEEESTVEDTGQAQEKAKEVAGQAKGRLREQVDQRSTEAGQQLSSAADDVRSVAEQFRTQGKDTPARYAEQAAEKAQKVGQRLQARERRRASPRCRGLRAQEPVGGRSRRARARARRLAHAEGVEQPALPQLDAERRRLEPASAGSPGSGADAVGRIHERRAVRA